MSVIDEVRDDIAKGSPGRVFDCATLLEFVEHLEDGLGAISRGARRDRTREDEKLLRATLIRLAAVAVRAVEKHLPRQFNARLTGVSTKALGSKSLLLFFNGSANPREVAFSGKSERARILALLGEDVSYTLCPVSDRVQAISEALIPF